MAGPEWMTSNFLQSKLEKNLREEDVLVKTFTMGPVNDAGHKYSSTVTRVSAKTWKGPRSKEKERDRSFILKTMPADSSLQDKAFKGRMFTREASMLKSCIPEIRHALTRQKKDGAEPISELPLAPYHIFESELGAPEIYLMINDLRKDGFRAADRSLGLDLPQSVLVMRTLALFHGASADYLNDFDDPIKALGNPYALLKGFIDMTVNTVFPLVARICREWEEYAVFGDAIDEVMLDAVEGLVEWHGIAVKHNVICHGDLWVDKILFRYEGDEVKEVRFIDFQMSHVSTPAADLLRFLTTSVNADVLKSSWDVLIQNYQEVLEQTMRKLKTPPPPSLKDVEDLLSNAKVIAVYDALVLAPIAKAEELPPPEWAISEPNKYYSYLYESENVQEWLRLVLEALAKKNWICCPEFMKARKEAENYSKDNRSERESS